MKTVSRAARKFAKILKQVRRTQGITQEELGHLIGSDAAHISKIENGRKEISLATAVRLAQALEVQLFFADQSLNVEVLPDDKPRPTQRKKSKGRSK